MLLLAVVTVPTLKPAATIFASAVACGWMFPTTSIAQDAPAAEPAPKKAFERPKKFRKLAPDVLTTIPVTVVFLLAQRRVIQGMADGAVKG